MGVVSRPRGVTLAAATAGQQVGGAMPIAIPAALVLALGFSNGGYAPTTWGWSALALTGAGLVALALRRSAGIGRFEAGFAVGLALLFGLQLASTWWGMGSETAIGNAERTLIYVAAALVLPLLLRPARVERALFALVGAITVVAGFGVMSRLLPLPGAGLDDLTQSRLAEPLGYWNALGVFAAIGLAVALGFADDGRPAVRAWCAAALVPLALTTYLTFSRGAWVALAIGLAVGAVSAPRRLRFAARVVLLSVPALVAISIAVRIDALSTWVPTDTSPWPARALLVVSVGLTWVAIRLALRLEAVEQQVAATRIGRGCRELRVALTPAIQLLGRRRRVVVAVGATVCALLVASGAVARLTSSAWSTFAAKPRGGATLNDRYTDLSGSGRAESWTVAFDAGVAHPVLGSGAGSFERIWLANRPSSTTIRDAHSLYLETFAELGLAGLAILLTTFALPFLAAWRVRRERWAVAALAGWTVFVVHAGIDWDWEMPAVTLAGLVVAGVLLAGARRPAQKLTPISHGLASGALTSAAVVAVLGLVGSQYLASAGAARAAGDPQTAIRAANEATRWQPWSTAGRETLALALFDAGDTRGAIAALRNAIAHDADNWALWFDLARMSDGRPQASALAHAARLNPRSPEIAAFRTELGL